jgi:hypothetical protein
MRVGIVGSEEAKFTSLGKTRATEIIRGLLDGATAVVSGACHLGGIDIWSASEGRSRGFLVLEFPSRSKNWSGPGGYCERNLKIVDHSDLVVCITVKQLPKDYNGMRFPKCYHCNTTDHVKSGGCWTMHQARKQGKAWKLHVVENY